MAETYCVKTCESCSQKEALNCPGCKAGPGRLLQGTCEIAQCCRSKGHETCLTCTTKPYCGKFSGRANMPEYFARKQRTAQEHKDMVARRAPFLGKWLWLLFWLVVPSEIAGLMTNDTVAGWFPALLVPGQILTAVTLIAYGGILWVLREEDERYRTAAKCTFASAVLSVITLLIGSAEALSGIVVILTLGNGVVAMFGEYNEYTAHATVTNILDSHLSEQWDNLWKWYIGTFAATLGSAVLAIVVAAMQLGLLAILLMLAMVAAAIGTAVVGILKLVYLYRTAQLFRHHNP